MSDPTPLEPGRPAIVLVSDAFSDRLRDAFWRYSREYDLRDAHSTEEALAIADEIGRRAGKIAMFVGDSVLPDADIRDACRRWRDVVPGARLAVIAPIQRLIVEAPTLRPELSKGTSTPTSCCRRA